MILKLVSYAGNLFGFLFLTLSIASGLYYISELVEEYSEPTKRFLTRAIYGVIGLLVSLLIFDKFPFKLTVFAIASHVLYLQNMKGFPFVSFTNPTFLLSCACTVLNHYLWFKYFNDVEIPPQFKFNPNYIPKKRATFSEVASFFAICVWFIPFSLFVSLSAGDYVLPTAEELKKTDDPTAQPKLRKRTINLVRVAINNVRGFIRSSLRIFGFKIAEPEYDRLSI
ncbi:Svp26p KNAG_0D02690 [Huiozyma naganishii CBS 8797]|uniref:Protein SVP26 n=1 Tax=Huiozyma naganishii (strain ATCC MYA-139 / BCRC 22969 / CBS 8797 / KCTC 17520 / NBRC 10181 / NCYC 3082 / Yp74L-3) TaxID=1071383 RepID=J7RKK4_HUIN7|nr:hypothetical protein KNAG_0D02690 [Kazachstania naganishii CBS 8797]CCK70018.1 hypothetical protein KNAG_0D02690 [Kazachstania naganishii CBS 8797]